MVPFPLGHSSPFSPIPAPSTALTFQWLVPNPVGGLWWLLPPPSAPLDRPSRTLGAEWMGQEPKARQLVLWGLTMQALHPTSLPLPAQDPLECKCQEGGAS